MQTLIIGSQDFRQGLESCLTTQARLLWARGLSSAFERLEAADVDLIVFDSRNQPDELFTDLKSLIYGTPVTTRVLAIVDQLPNGELFAESGVVYLTPPVNFRDIGSYIDIRSMDQPR